MVWLETEEKAPKQVGIKMRNVRWPYGNNRQSTVLYAYRPNEDHAVSCAWADPSAQRIGINLRRMHASGKMSVTSLPKLGALMWSRWLTRICLLLTIPALADEWPGPVSAGWQGESVCEVLHEDAELPTVRCTFSPGVGHVRHFHPRHFGRTLSGGKMQITSDSGTREVTLKTGSYFFSEGIAWHEAVNVGDTTASYLTVEPK